MTGNLDRAISIVYYATMPRPHRHATIDEDLLPSWTTRSHDYARQVESMREIRELTNNVAGAYRRRDELFHALALSNSLSRQDMARAAGLNKTRVDQIIREMAEEDQRRKNVEAEERVRRHMP
jgi:hypothetical protein